MCALRLDGFFYLGGNRGFGLEFVAKRKKWLSARLIAELAFRYRLPRERKRRNSGTPFPLFPQTRASRGATRPIAELAFHYRLPRERKRPNSGTPFPLFPQTRAPRGATHPIEELAFRYCLPRERKRLNSGTPFPLFPQTRASRGATRLIAGSGVPLSPPARAKTSE